MFRWLQALVTMAILMAAAYWIAQVVGGLYDEYNHFGILTLIGLGLLALSLIGLVEGLWERWRNSRRRQG